MKSRSSAQRCGFSLVELLVVIGVIALLVGILIPAISVAVQRSKEAATVATIRGLETACNTFRANSNLGGAYPPSGPPAGYAEDYRIAKPTSTSSNPDRFESFEVTGASLLVWGVLGADYQGTPGFPGGWPDRTHAYFDAVGSQANGLYAFKPDGTPAYQRIKPTIERDKLELPEIVAGGFKIPASETLLPAPCALDSFGQPILYYRARKGAPNILSSGQGGVFDMYDNAWITGHPSNPGPEMPGLDLGTGPHPVADPNVMVEFLRDPKSPTGRPHNEDSFILWSAGADGLYGTADDLANFEINK